MKQGLTEIVVILDRSGSMESIRDDAIGGFNAFMESQKAVAGEATSTLVQFNTTLETVHENVPLQDMPLLDSKTYVPGGGTALLDAVGLTVDRVGKRLAVTPEDKRPEKVMVAILTDGEEN